MNRPTPEGIMCCRACAQLIFAERLENQPKCVRMRPRLKDTVMAILVQGKNKVIIYYIMLPNPTEV